MEKIEEKSVTVQANSISLEASLAIPKGARGIVLFAHGSGSSRLSPRNIYVAKELQRAGLATILMDLLTEEEDVQYERRFDIKLLSKRLIAGINWIKKEPATKSLAIGLFGASTGAAAALEAAAQVDGIRAVVSRGGRPDLAAEEGLAGISTPTLFIVGGKDETVIELNQRVYQRLKAAKKLVIIPGATHLFEESGALEAVAKEAAKWFVKYLAR